MVVEPTYSQFKRDFEWDRREICIIDEMEKLGVNPDAQIVINEEMKPYLQRHRGQLK
tara:strand:- start:125 stop:295 length:171 start_codon:yes stop_codon:yes gene_type:complete